MELRRIRAAADARACLSAAAASGLARPTWARSRGIDPRSLDARRLNLARGGSELVAPLGLVEVTSRSPEGASSGTYAICVGAYRVEVDDEFEAGTLRRLLAAVCPC